MAERTCSIEGCDRSHYGRGWCRRHYDRWIKHGDPTGGGPGRRARMPETCTVKDCSTVSYRKGWCKAHYHRWKLHGDLSWSSRDANLERFEKRFIVDEDSGCWIWQGVLDKDGYGNFTRNTRAHRWSYEAFIGPIPDDLVIDHLCRNRACVNPLHLEPTTSGDNCRRSPEFWGNKELCDYGHPLDGWTKRSTNASGWGRYCKTCHRERVAASRQMASQ